MLKFKYLNKNLRIQRLQRIILSEQNYVICSLLTPQFFNSQLTSFGIKPLFLKNDFFNYFLKSFGQKQLFCPTLTNVSFLVQFPTERAVVDFIAKYKLLSNPTFCIVICVNNSNVYTADQLDGLLLSKTYFLTKFLSVFSAIFYSQFSFMDKTNLYISKLLFVWSDAK